MNKINKLFSENKERKLLSLYFCAGCPTLEGTGTVIKEMERHGIELTLVSFFRMFTAGILTLGFHSVFVVLPAYLRVDRRFHCDKLASVIDVDHLSRAVETVHDALIRVRDNERLGRLAVLHHLLELVYEHVEPVSGQRRNRDRVRVFSELYVPEAVLGSVALVVDVKRRLVSSSELAEQLFGRSFHSFTSLRA